MKQEITVLSHSASGYQSPDIQICQYVCKETILQTSGITGKSMCLSIYLSKSEQEVFDI